MLLGTQYIPLLVSWKIPEYCGTVEAVISQFFDKFSQIIAVFQLVARFLKSPSLHAFLSIFSQCVRSKEVLIFLLFHRSHLLWKIRKFWNHLKIMLKFLKILMYLILLLIWSNIQQTTFTCFNVWFLYSAKWFYMLNEWSLHSPNDFNMYNE